MVDTASYDATDPGGFGYELFEAGVSLSMDPANLVPSANDDPDDWCAATSVYNTDGTSRDFGTPGAANDPCRLPASFDCGLAVPIDITTSVGANVTLNLWINVPGWTDVTPSANEPAHPLIEAYLIRGTGTNDAAWNAAAFTRIPSSPWRGISPGDDSYGIDTQARGPGTEYFVFDVTTNGGKTFTRCDNNGQPYDSANAGVIVTN
jgi:hypothetical protein